MRPHQGELPDVTIDPDSDACIFYTSGHDRESRRAPSRPTAAA
ncbi:MAG: hypothetical protein U5R48_12115 [Gammaproteobacteria bacterium]|nr:hypothetical protein [Gammaproteobacteria bacterium]